MTRRHQDPRLHDGPTKTIVRAGNDGHLRLSVLLAEAASPTAAPETIQAATHPKQTWAARLKALEGLIQTHRPTVQLVDIDAAWPESVDATSRMDDASCTADRLELFDRLMIWGQELNWSFERPAPKLEVSQALEQSGISLGPLGQDALSFPVPALPPAMRSLASWLVESERVQAAGFWRIVGESPDPTSTVFEAFYDGVGPRARAALERCAVLREQHLLNGVLGPYRFDTDELGVSRKGVNRLVDAGAVETHAIPSVETRWFHVPSVLRERVLRRTESVEGEEVRSLRNRLARVLVSKSSTEERLEARRLAVLSGDIDLMRAARPFYGSDLRIVARGFSLRAKNQSRGSVSARKLNREAANIYHSVVTEYDESDAYCWHYFAFNTERACTDKRGALHVTPSEAASISKGYQQSCVHADRREFNPLFHGRRLAFELRLGKDVLNEIRTFLVRTESQYGRNHTSFFIFPLARMMKEQGSWKQLTQSYPWTESLKKNFSPRRLDLET